MKFQSLESAIVDIMAGRTSTESDCYRSLESSILEVVNEADKKAEIKDKKAEMQQTRAKDAETQKVNDKEGNEKKDPKKDDETNKDLEDDKTGKETQKDATMPTKDADDKEIGKDSAGEGEPDGKKEKVVMYPRLGESLTFTENDHQIGDTIRYGSKSSSHFKVGKVVKRGDNHVIVKNGKYHSKVAHQDIVHNERPTSSHYYKTPFSKTEDYETKQPSVLQTEGSPNVTPGSDGQEMSSLPTTESVKPKIYKIGDTVTPKIGPHKNKPHSVIHVFPSGKLNIKPIGIHPDHNRYALGAAGCDPKNVS